MLIKIKGEPWLPKGYRYTCETAQEHEDNFHKALNWFSKKNDLDLTFDDWTVRFIDGGSGEVFIVTLQTEVIAMGEAIMWGKFLAHYANEMLNPTKRLTFNDTFFETDEDNKVVFGITAVRGAK